MRATFRIGLALCTGLLVVGATSIPFAGAAGRGGDVAEVRAATSKYHRLDVAVDEGLGALADLQGLTCIEDPGGAGAMGVHYVNGGRVVDGRIDPAEPEVLLYDLSTGAPRLLGVEYVVFVADWTGADPPELFGHEFSLVGAGNRYGLPPFYELHAWVWEHNPSGMFEDWNPRIDC